MNYNDLDTVSRLISIDTQLTAKFRQIDIDRYKAFNMLVSKLQLDPDVRAKLEREGRPTHAYNLIAPVIKNISSSERAGRKKLAVIGRTEEDDKVCEILNYVMDFFHSKADLNRQFTRAALDAFIAKWGWIYQGWSFEDDPEGMEVIQRVNPFSIRMDLEFTDITLKDCKYLERTTWMSVEEILQTYALDDEKLQNLIIEKNEQYMIHETNKPKNVIATWSQRLWGALSSLITGENNESFNPNIMMTNLTWYDPNTSRFKIIELHERRLIKRMFAYDPETNKKRDITDLVGNDSPKGYDDAKLDALRQSELKNSIITRDLVKQIWVTSVIPAFDCKVEDNPYEIQNGNFKYTLISAYDYHADLSKTQSVVDELIDPQSSYNKRRATMLEIITKFSVPGIVMEEGADEGFEDEWTDRKIGSIRHTATGKFDKWKTDSPNINLQGLAQFEAEDFMLIEKISAVPPAAKGEQESKNESGRLYIAKRQQSELMLQYLFDNVTLAKHTIGRNSIDLYQYYLTEERIFRISGDEKDPIFIRINQKTVNGIVNDITIGKFDVEISDSPYSATAKEVEYMKLLDIFDFIRALNPQAAFMLLPTLVKASGTPYRDEIMTVLNRLIGITDEQMKQKILGDFINTERSKLGLQNEVMENENRNLENKGRQTVDNAINDLVSGL